MTVYDRMQAGTEALEQLKKAIPATQYIDLDDTKCFGKIGKLENITVWKGILEREDDTEKEYVAVNKNHTTVMLLDEEGIDEMIETLEKAKKDSDSFSKQNSGEQ